MRKLSIDGTWDYTKRMWKWIAFQKFCEDERHVIELKKVWLRENAPEFADIRDDCFFCDARTHEGGCDITCPASLVDGPFDCQREGCHYVDNPGAFYREILRLDAIRTAEPVVVEHEWKHGDVFKYNTGAIMIYIQLKDRSFAYCLQPGSHRPKKNYHPCRVGNQSYLNEKVEHLFNIRDKL